MHQATGEQSYDRAVSEHRWVVPERYNIAADICDRHPRDKLAMIHEHFTGARSARLRWGELQDRSNQIANVLAGLGVERGRPCRRAAAADAGDGRGLLRDLEDRGDPALDVGAVRRRGDRATGSRDSEPKVLVTDAAQRRPA